jgi:hypothetical protein
LGNEEFAERGRRRLYTITLHGKVVVIGHNNQRGLDLMFYASFFAAGLVAGFVCCWAVARHLLTPLKNVLEAAGDKVGED